jgi:hypothetical protein
MQEPLFRRYGIDGAGFWAEVDGLEDLYLRHGAKRVSKDTLYLNHILTYVRAGVFKGLNNNVLRELGSEIELYEGLPTFFDQVKQSVASDGSFVKHGLQVEHYIVSTGLREMIMGSKIAPFVEDVWGCEFVEVVAQPNYLQKGELPLQTSEPILIDIGYMVDNTSKTRAIFEINKGTNKLARIGVNDTIAHEDRRVPFQNMIYIADGPSDVPSFSILNQYGGRTFAVYKPRRKDEFKQVASLQELGRVQGIGEANYTEGSLTSMWILNAVEDIAKRIVDGRESLLNAKVGRSPGHIVNTKLEKLATVDVVAKAVIEDAQSITTESNAPSRKPQANEPRSGGRRIGS